MRRRGQNLIRCSVCAEQRLCALAPLSAYAGVVGAALLADAFSQQDASKIRQEINGLMRMDP